MKSLKSKMTSLFGVYCEGPAAIGALFSKVFLFIVESASVGSVTFCCHFIYDIWLSFFLSIFFFHLKCYHCTVHWYVFVLMCAWLPFLVTLSNSLKLSHRGWKLHLLLPFYANYHIELGMRLTYGLFTRLPFNYNIVDCTLISSCSSVCLVGFSSHKWHTLFLTLLNLKSWGLEVSTSATLTFKMPYKTKVRTPHNAIKLCYL